MGAASIGRREELLACRQRSHSWRFARQCDGRALPPSEQQQQQQQQQQAASKPVDEEWRGMLECPQTALCRWAQQAGSRSGGSNDYQQTAGVVLARSEAIRLNQSSRH